MKKLLLGAAAAILLLSCTGCTVIEEREAFAENFPDKMWENIWVIEEREAHIYLDTDLAVLDGYCLVHYRGEEPVENVSIIIRSPLTYDFIGPDKASHYGTVKPGDKLAYRLHVEYAQWEDKVPAYVFAEKVEDDFRGNYYVGISWSDGERQYNKRFFDWKGDKH